MVPRGCPLPSAEPRSKVINYLFERMGAASGEGVLMGPKERERRLAKQRVDRSHRTRGRVGRYHRPPPWTLGEKDALVLILAFIFAAAVLTVVLFVLQT